MAKKKAASEKLSFEQALQRLELIAQALEEGDLGLEESLTHYEEGVKRLKNCHEMLERAERKIELLSGVDAEGNPITQPFDDEASSLEEKAEQRSSRRSAPIRSTRSSTEEEEHLDEPPRLF